MAFSASEPAGVWKRIGDRVYLCGTLGHAFDRWQRARSAVSAAEGYAAQLEGLAEVEKLMDSLEAEARATMAADEVLLPRKSPGYASMPLSDNRDILDRLDAGRRLGVTLTESSLLLPSKSVTAVCEIRRKDCG